MGAEQSSRIQRYNGEYERERMMNESNNGVKVTLVNPEVHVHNSRDGRIRDDGMQTIVYSNSTQARQIRLLEEENREKEEHILQLQREQILKEKKDTDTAMLKMHNKILEKEKNLARQALQQEALAKEQVIIEKERVVQQKKLQLEEQAKLIRTQKAELEKYKEITKNVLEKVVQRQVDKKDKQKPFSHNIKLPEQTSSAGVQNKMKNMKINSENCSLPNDRKQINNLNYGQHKVGHLSNDQTSQKVGPVGSYNMGNYPPSTTTQAFMRNSNCQQFVPPLRTPLGTPPLEPPLGTPFGAHTAQFPNFNIPPPPLMNFDGNIKFNKQTNLEPNMVKRMPPPQLMNLDLNMGFYQQSNLVTNVVKRMPQQTTGRKKPNHNSSATNNSTNNFKVSRQNYGGSRRNARANRNSKPNEGVATNQRGNTTEESKENKLLEEQNCEKEEHILQLQREQILKEKKDTDTAMLKMHNEILQKEKNLAKQALQQEALAKEQVIIEKERVVQQKKLQLEEQAKLIRTQKAELEKYKEITKNVLEKVVQRQVDKKDKQKPFSHNIRLPEQTSLAGVQNKMKNMKINSENCSLPNDRKQINNLNYGKHKVGHSNDQTSQKVGPVGSYNIGNYPPSTANQAFMRNSNCQQIGPPLGTPLGTPPFEPPLGTPFRAHTAQFPNFNIPPPPSMDLDGNIKFNKQTNLEPNMVKRMPPPQLMNLDLNMNFNQQSNVVPNMVKRTQQQTNGRKKPNHNSSATNNPTNNFKVSRQNYGESRRKARANRNSIPNEGAATKQRDNTTEESKQDKVTRQNNSENTSEARGNRNSTSNEGAEIKQRDNTVEKSEENKGGTDANRNSTKDEGDRIKQRNNTIKKSKRNRGRPGANGNSTTSEGETTKQLDSTIMKAEFNCRKCLNVWTSIRPFGNGDVTQECAICLTDVAPVKLELLKADCDHLSGKREELRPNFRASSTSEILGEKENIDDVSD